MAQHEIWGLDYFQASKPYKKRVKKQTSSCSCSNSDVSKTDDEGKTDLFRAVQPWYNASSRVKELIDDANDVNITDDGKTALFYAVQQGSNESVVRELIDAGADVNRTDNEGKTALFYAFEQSNNESVVRELIDAGADINRTDNEGKTALFYAVQERDEESVVFASFLGGTLILAGANVNRTENKGKTTLFYAVPSGSESMVRTLIDAGADVNRSDKKGKTALFCAVQSGNDSVVRPLIDAGADVNITDNEGETALFYAVQSSNDSVLHALIAAGADVNITDNEGKTALFYAVQSGNESVVNALIDTGAGVNKTDNERKTALFYAVRQSNNESVVRALIDAGVDVNKSDNKGQTALYCTVEYGNKSVVFALIGGGADVNRTDNEGKTALFYAVEHGNKSVVCVLIAAGAGVNRTDNKGKTALFYAVQQSSNESMACTLIAAGAGVNITDNEGKTALFYAVQQRCNESVVGALIDADADVNITDNEGKTALFYAVEYGNESVVCALIDAVADVNTASDKYGETALFYAVLYGNDKMVRVLIEKGNAFTSPRDNYGRTPLFYAMTKSPTLIHYLLDRNASMYSVDNCKISILSFFIDKCMVDKNDLPFQLERINILIQRGMNRKKIFEAIISVIFRKYFLLLTSRIDFETFNVVLTLAKTYVTDEKDIQSVGNISQRMSKTNQDRTSHGTVIPEILDLLFELGADPSSADSDGNTALHYAACLPFYGTSEEKTIELLNKLENTGAMIDAKNHKQETPLLYCLSCFCRLASKTDKPINILVGVCTFFLEHGSDITETTQSGKSVFHFVIEGFQQVLNWHDISKEKDAFQEGIKLLQVLSSGNEATCKIHVAVNKRNANLNSPLHLWASLEPVYQCFNHCAFQKFLKAILHHLLNCGVILDDRNISDQTPLHLCRTWTAVQLLLDAGANPNVVDSSGCTILLVAAKNKTFLQRPEYFYPDVHLKSKAFWKTVLRRGFDPWKVDIHGQSVLDILMGSKAIDLAKGLIEVSCDESYLQSHKIVILLLNSLCRDNSMNAQWKSKYVETILKSIKCSVSGSTQEDSPLHLCFKNIIRASKALSVNEVKMTVHWTIARHLISYGADPRISDGKGQSCLDIAKEYPPLNELCTSVNIALHIPWTSVSKLHKYKLAKVARRQESKHVYSFWYHMEPLAQGSFGAVFVGINEKDGREVAVKRIEKVRMPRPEDKREATNLTTLADCEQVTRYLCFFEDEDFSYVVLELMDGNLNEFLTKKTTVDTREKFCQDVVKGVSYLHGLNILHRDLKPTNILFKTHPKLCLKIADFGLSNQIDNTGSTTVFGTNVGTRCWIAPEVLKATKVHLKSSDVFACGLVLHYILSVKKHPFAPADCFKKGIMQINHETEANVLSGHMEGWDDSIHPEANHLIKQMLDSNESKRPAATEALKRPFFWTKKKKLNLLIAVGNQREFECPRAKRTLPLTAVETDLETNFGIIVKYVDWNDPGYVHMPAIYTEMMKKRKTPYDTKSVVELVRFIRNAYGHLSEDQRPTLIRKLLLEDFVFLEYFPNLVMEVYKVVTTHGWDQTREEIKYSLYA